MDLYLSLMPYVLCDVAVCEEIAKVDKGKNVQFILVAVTFRHIIVTSISKD